jgi:hypothetical protein
VSALGNDGQGAGQILPYMLSDMTI